MDTATALEGLLLLSMDTVKTELAPSELPEKQTLFDKKPFLILFVKRYVSVKAICSLVYLL